MVWDHAMSCVPEQSDPPIIPAFQRWASEECPPLGGWCLANHFLDSRVPAFERAKMFILFCGYYPGLIFPRSVVSTHQQEVLLATTDRIMQQVAAWAHPELDTFWVGQRWQKLGRNNAPPAVTTRELSIIIAKHFPT